MTNQIENDFDFDAAVQTDPRLKKIFAAVAANPRLQDINETLIDHAALEEAVSSLVEVTRSDDVALRRADTAEVCVREGVRKVGQATMQTWAILQAERADARARAEHPSLRKNQKKKLYWSTTLGEITVIEQTYRKGSGPTRPFSQSANVRCRMWSLPLLRLAIDLAADEAFGKAVLKSKEHHCIDLSESTLQRRCREIGEEIAAMKVPPGLRVENQKAIIAQMDGSMVPITEPNPDDPRHPFRFWREVRLAVAFVPGEDWKIYGGGTIDGGVPAAGEALRRCVTRAGFCESSHVYGMGDGASWIADQFQRQFGDQQSYLVDLYHVCVYLAAAAAAFAATAHKQASWVLKQKERLKNGELDKVLRTVKSAIEPEDVADENAPVRKCHRYFKNRPGQFEYLDAINNDRPVGSGVVESGNKSVVGGRMKKPGAAWRVKNAESMIAIRICRANAGWGDFWDAKMAA